MKPFIAFIFILALFSTIGSGCSSTREIYHALISNLIKTGALTVCDNDSNNIEIHGLVLSSYQNRPVTYAKIQLNCGKFPSTKTGPDGTFVICIPRAIIEELGNKEAVFSIRYSFNTSEYTDREIRSVKFMPLLASFPRFFSLIFYLKHDSYY